MSFTHREVTVTGIYVHETRSWSLWLAEVDSDGNYVLRGHCLGTEKKLLDQFGELVRGLEKRSLPLPKDRRL